MKNSLIDQLIAHLHRQYEQGIGGWVAKGELTSVQWRDKKGKTYLPETVGRTLRDAEVAKYIAVRPRGVSVEYKWIPHERRVRYITTSERRDPFIIFKPTV